MRLLYFIVLQIILAVACTNSTKQNSVTEETKSDTLVNQPTTPSLANTLYLFAPELDTSNCTATGACDCCSGNVLFLNDSAFVIIDYCEANYSFGKGKYKFDGEVLTLNLDKLNVLKDYNWEKETDTTGKVTTEYFYRVENTKPTTLKYKKQLCKDALIFKGKQEYGAIDKGRNLSELIDSLKHEKIWTRLRLK